MHLGEMTMHFSVLFFFLSWISITFYPTHVKGLCRHLKFTPLTSGYALQGHVIKNISLNIHLAENIPSRCNNYCTMESKCVSFNIGPPIKDIVLCQLSNADHIQHPKDLQAQEGFMYRGTENPCSSNPCLHNATCLSGYTASGYLCKCQDGYSGEHCEKALYNFTTLGATGRNGPDNNAGYTGTGLQNIQLKDGKQKWIVPFDGRFRVEACGASGGEGFIGSEGGRGAKVSGNVLLKKGEELIVLVGQRGSSQSDFYPGSGGGGTFIFSQVGPLLVAGGGGGGASQNGFPGNDKQNGSGVGAGSHGLGGLICRESGSLDKTPDSGSGAGINGSGGCFSGEPCTRNTCDKGGKSYTEGGKGGQQQNCDGGFGGGGACTVYTPGGGGGYSGGGVDHNKAGGGGGSFVDACVTDSVIKGGGCDEGDGYVSFISAD